ncbi:hypothetical protein ACFL0M_09810 [Thermodesulfobacteriota bacterium]
MKTKEGCRLLLLIICFYIGCFIIPLPADGAILYKNYVIRPDKGRNILCDSYTVQKNDWVYKLFRQRGEISHKDFPEFIRIFKRINTHLSNINRILPGQHILIPLKKIDSDVLPEKFSGIVAIPFVNISNVPETLKAHAQKHEVQKGEFISRLVARGFGAYGTESYNHGEKLFRIMNPEISDLNRIYPGQSIYIPLAAVKNQPWYPFLFDSSGKVKSRLDFAGVTAPEKSVPGSYSLEERLDTLKGPFEKVAALLDGKLLNQGVYYFPRPGEADLKLDLSQFPVIELKDGERILFARNDAKPLWNFNLLKSFWRNLKIVPVSRADALEQILNSAFGTDGSSLSKTSLLISEHGVRTEIRAQWKIDKPSESGEKARRLCITFINSPDQRTPPSISEYLEQHDIITREILLSKKDAGEDAGRQSEKVPDTASVKKVSIVPFNGPRAFVENLAKVLKYRYVNNVGITFPYAGIQIEAQSDLISKDDDKEVFIDFGDLYGDAVQAIAQTGRTIIKITAKDSPDEIIEKILRAMGGTYSIKPVFWAAKRPSNFNTSITIPGFLISDTGTPGILIATVPLPEAIIRFLKQQDLTIVLVETSALSSQTPELQKTFPINKRTASR